MAPPGNTRITVMLSFEESSFVNQIIIDAIVVAVGRIERPNVFVTGKPDVDITPNMVARTAVVVFSIEGELGEDRRRIGGFLRDEFLRPRADMNMRVLETRIS